MDAVSQVLSARSHEQGTMSGMLGASVFVHAVLVATAVLAPATWFGGVAPDPQVVMTISLGGPAGPAVGGMTPQGARPVQTVAPPKPVEAVQAPAAKPPEMIQPTKVVPKKAAEPPPVAPPPETPVGRTPTAGQEVTPGSAPSAAASARGQGFGLASGGGGTGSYLDTADFCCPEYIALMIEQIRSNWDYRAQQPGTALLRFRIQRDGTITGVAVERSSGYQALDFIAQRALQLTRRLPPLPQSFTEPSLGVHLTFEYSRQ